MKKTKTVFVGLSGGVDSSVAALRLKRQGYQVVGVFIKVWHPDFMVCNWETERLDAMRVAAHLEIPFLTCDAEAAYRDEVAHYFIEEYKAGRTPNPDVLCNKEVKFGAFLRFAKERGADYIATGHYVRRIEKGDIPELHRGIDQNKDQSYFLWSLTNEQLSISLFPIGDTEKTKVRDEAKKAGIPTATKKDSQGVCFLGHIDIKEFLSHYTELKRGKVLATDGGVIGSHEGSLIYTIGQRHGFSLTDTNANRVHNYVIAKDISANTITVSDEKLLTKAQDVFTLHTFIFRKRINIGDVLEAQFRYRQTPFSVEVTNITGDVVTIKTLAETETPASGQSCVVYEGSHCIGGGILT